MDMIRKNGLKTLLFMAIFLPYWLTFGKSIFSVEGWFALAYIFTVAPLLLIGLLIIWLLLRKRPDVRETKRIGSVDAIVLIFLYISVFMHGVFLVDGTDVKADPTSIAANIFEMSHSLSMNYAVLFFALSIILLFAMLGLSLYELWTKKAIS